MLVQCMLWPYVHLSVCLSICLLQANIVPKWLNVGSRKLCRLIPRDSNLLMPQILMNSNGVIPTRALNIDGVDEN